MSGTIACGASSDPGDGFNTIGGHFANTVASGVVGSTIGGGGNTNGSSGNYTPNSIAANYSTVAGGAGNTIQPGAFNSVIGGGTENQINSGAFLSTIGGGSLNLVDVGGVRSTIAGGWQNSSASDGAAIGGGWNNNIGPNTMQAAIGGGSNNTIQAGAALSTIGGGIGNTIQSNALYSVIAGGGNNVVQTGAVFSVISGGQDNLIQTNGTYSAVAGGYRNQIFSLPSFTSSYSSIAGGYMNVMEAYNDLCFMGAGQQNRMGYDGLAGVIAGGSYNDLRTNAYNSTIGGGYGNIISNYAHYATIPGGYNNVAGQNYAFAAGQNAKANHAGAFVWADSQGGPFASTANNQFLIRAGGNVGINKTNPATALDVNGTITATGFSGLGAGLTGISASGLPADVAYLDANQTFTGSPTFSGVVNYQNVAYLNDNDVHLRNDSYHGLGWYRRNQAVCQPERRWSSALWVQRRCFGHCLRRTATGLAMGHDGQNFR